jgi:hypothetical protein
LTRDPFQPDASPCLRARIFGLARIRTLESLEGLLEMLATSGANVGTRRLQPQMEDVRIALMLLTGVDQGRSPELWERWWRANRKGFRLAAELPLLPKELRREWDIFWGQSTTYERERRREERGAETPPRKP